MKFVVKIIWYGRSHVPSMDTGAPVSWHEAKETVNVLMEGTTVFAWIEPA